MKKTYITYITPAHSTKSGEQAGERMSLHPFPDERPISDSRGRRVPFRVVFRLSGFPKGLWRTSCRGVDGGDHGSLDGHRDFKTTASAVKWLSGSDRAGKPS